MKSRIEELEKALWDCISQYIHTRGNCDEECTNDCAFYRAKRLLIKENPDG